MAESLITVTNADISSAVDAQYRPHTALAELIHKINREHGFWEAERNDGEVLALIHSEISEALEELRSGKHAPLYWVDDKNGISKPEGYAVELIDAVIRIYDYLYERLTPLGIEVEDILYEKIKYNNQRPYKHGRQF